MPIVTPQTPAQFEAYFDLRWRLLRAPWGQPRGSERDDHEVGATHRMLINEQQRVLAVGRLHTLERDCGQLRYMAVDPTCQGQGLGKQILASLEEAARQQGLKTLFLHARESVIGFYQHHGYERLGQSHTLYGKIVHHQMRKTLEPSP